MTNALPPAFIFIAGALIIPFLKGRVKEGYLLLLPLVGLICLLNIPEGAHLSLTFLNYNLTLVKVDRLSLVFGYIFHIISFITIIYSIKFRNDVEYVAGFLYAGSALGVIFAGDLLSLFFFWEAMTLSSVFLIWARGTKASISAGFRYLLVHIFGGFLLLAGIIIHIHEGGSTEF